MRTLKEAVFIVIIAIFPASLGWARWQFSSRELAHYEVLVKDARLDSPKVVWIDARSRDEFEKEHVPGAVLLNEQGWDQMLAGVFENWEPETPIVVYCEAGCQSSEKVAGRLRDLGLEPVYFLRGGYDAWKKSHAR